MVKKKEITTITMCNGFNHTPVISFLQISGQLTFGKNLSKWGLGASISLDQGKKKKITLSKYALNSPL